MESSDERQIKLTRDRDAFAISHERIGMSNVGENRTYSDIYVSGFSAEE